MPSLVFALLQIPTGSVQYATPVAVARGFDGTVTLRGRGLERVKPFTFTDAGVRVRAEKPGTKFEPPGGTAREESGDSHLVLKITVPKTYAGGVVALPFAAASGGRYRLAIDPPDAVAEREPNGGFGQSQPLELPATLAGGFGHKQDVDVVRFALARGQSLDVVGTSHGGPADLVLTLWDAGGRQLAAGDQRTGYRLRHTARAGGEFWLGLADASDRGGPAFGYRATLSVGGGD